LLLFTLNQVLNKMTEYWVSQAKKFCDFCKCWLSDNKASIEFHEAGKKHKANVQAKLTEIGIKGRKDELKAKREEAWIEKMNQAAMKTYRNKDLEGANPDMTAKLFEAARAQREEDRVTQSQEKDEIAEKAKKAAAKAGFDTGQPSTSKAGPSRDPMLECIPDRRRTHSECSDDLVQPEDGDDDESSPKVRKMEAPKSGTKWHNPPDAKKWFEAKTGDGTIYFWHVESHESRWEPPPEGYLSIKDQEEINRKHEEREQKKLNKIIEAQNIHSHAANYSNEAAAEAAQVAAGPPPKADAYGGWQNVEKRKDKNVIDYQAVKPSTSSSDNQPAVTLHDDRAERKKFETKKTPKLGSDSFEADISAGIVDTGKTSKKAWEGVKQDTSQASEPSKPAIVFRKRKPNPEKSIRKTEND